MLGSTDVPTVQAFMKVFEQKHYTPKMFIAASGPDQGAAFTTAVEPGQRHRDDGARRLVPRFP